MDKISSVSEGIHDLGPKQDVTYCVLCGACVEVSMVIFLLRCASCFAIHGKNTPCFVIEKN